MSRFQGKRFANRSSSCVGLFRPTKRDTLNSRRSNPWPATRRSLTLQSFSDRALWAAGLPNDIPPGSFLLLGFGQPPGVGGAFGGPWADADGYSQSSALWWARSGTGSKYLTEVHQHFK